MIGVINPVRGRAFVSENPAKHLGPPEQYMDVEEPEEISG
jgi:hypothetical protein